MSYSGFAKIRMMCSRPRTLLAYNTARPMCGGVPNNQVPSGFRAAVSYSGFTKRKMRIVTDWGGMEDLSDGSSGLSQQKCLNSAKNSEICPISSDYSQDVDFDSCDSIEREEVKVIHEEKKSEDKLTSLIDLQVIRDNCILLLSIRYNLETEN